MISKNEVRRVNLHLPRSWNQCTTEELELIATGVISQSMTTDCYHPFSWEKVKVGLILSINHLVIIGNAENEKDGYEVRFQHRQPWYKRIIERIKGGDGSESFVLSAEHIADMVPILNWIDDDKASPLTIFPYPTLRIGRRTYEGAPPMLDGYTWKEYRHLQEWMQLYVHQSNIAAAHRKRRSQAAALIDDMRNIDMARSNFLAVLLRSRDKDGNLLPKPFRNFDAIRWQVILFWWSGMMRYLQHLYPRCFKPADKRTRRQRQPNPLELYTRTTATMEKYVGLNEQEVNNQSFHVILQHMEDIAKENDEMEKMRKKNK